MSKGSGRRPAAIPRDEYAERWERTFGAKRETLVVNGSFGLSGFRVREHYTEHADGTRTDHLPGPTDAEA